MHSTGKTERTSIEEMKPVMMLSLVALVESMQLVMIIAFICSFFPIKPAVFVEHLFPIYRYDVRPEHEMFLYRCWVLLAIGIQALLVFVFYQRSRQQLVPQGLLMYLIAQGCFLAGLIFVVFKMFIYPQYAWVKPLFIVIAGLSYAVKLFWPEIVRLGRAGLAVVATDVLSNQWLLFIADLMVIAIIAVVIYCPDLKEVLGLAYASDGYYHIDGFLAAAAWAFHQGLALNVDVISQYGVVLPAVTSWLSTVTGGFTYELIVQAFMCVTILYFIGWYFLLKNLLGQRVLAAGAVLLAINWQMFHTGILPNVWRFLTPTVVRFAWDIVFFTGIALILRKNSLTLRVMLAITCGIALAWMLDTGLYLLGTFYFFLLIEGFKRKKWEWHLAVLPWLIFIVVLLLVGGSAIFRLIFWHNFTGHMALFIQGWGALKISSSFLDNNFGAPIVGLTIPVFYLSVFSYCTIRWIKDESGREEIICSLLSLYGLGLYHYYILRSAITSYQVVIIPAVIILMMMFSGAVKGKRNQGYLSAGLFLCIAIGLVTNNVFLIYPNIMHWHNPSLEMMREVYPRQENLAQEKELILRLTRPGERVALICSTETRVLMMSKRTPYFFYFPLIESVKVVNGFLEVKTYLHTKERLNATIDQLKQNPPPYVFIHREMWHLPLATGFEGFGELRRYLQEAYVVNDGQGTLVALKRR